MKKIPLLLVCLCLYRLSPAQSNESIDGLIRPLLDSLRIDPSTEEMHSLRLVSVFPASRSADPRFDDFSTTGVLKYFTPENAQLTGRTTEPIALLGGMRIALEYALFDEREQVEPTSNYTFTSRAETAPDGTKLIRQTLELTGPPDRQIDGGFVEAIIWDARADRPVEIGRPVYRHILVYRGDREPGHATHLMHDADGVYSPVDFTEGSDRTFASFKGGRTGEFVYVIRNMKFPREALEKNLQANVHVAMTVTARGKVKNVDFLIEPDPAFRAEALRLARKTAGKWIPATRNGENIDEEKVMHIPFYPEYAPQW